MIRFELSQRLREGIYDHVFDTPNREVGGVLIGHAIPDGGGVVVRDFISALEAEGDLTTLTFTHDAWASIHEKLDHPDFDGMSIVGWYHSHPGHGIFLSEHDVFIHKHFFADPSNVAYVIDPQQGLQGWFGWMDGEIVAAPQSQTDWEGVGPESKQHWPMRAGNQAGRRRKKPSPKLTAKPAPKPARKQESAPQLLLAPQPYPLFGYLLPLAAGLAVGLLLALLVMSGDSAHTPSKSDSESFDISAVGVMPQLIAADSFEFASAGRHSGLNRSLPNEL